MSKHNSKQQVVQVDILDNKNDAIDYILVKKKLRGLGTFETSDPNDYVQRKDIDAAAANKTVIASAGDDVVVDWQNDIDPFGDGNQTYSERHGNFAPFVSAYYFQDNYLVVYNPTILFTLVPGGDDMIQTLTFTDLFPGKITLI